MTVDERARTVAPGRAAQELELRREEFRLAVQLGLVRTVPVGEAGRRQVERCELDRLRAAPDFPAGLRDRVRAVGTGEAAALLDITPERFTRLARTGHVSPVRFSVNRYRAVVWSYLAEEVAEFGLGRPALLTGRLPLDLRERLAAHEDLRPRNWRARRLGVLLRATDDPWARAAAIASLLAPVQTAEVVDDPYERAHLDRLRPPAPPGMPVRAAAREIAERLTRAADPDEILWQRMSLALALDEARADRPAPYPGERTPDRPRASVPAAAGVRPVSFVAPVGPVGRVGPVAPAASVGRVEPVATVPGIPPMPSVPPAVPAAVPVPVARAVSVPETGAIVVPGAGVPGAVVRPAGHPGHPGHPGRPARRSGRADRPPERSVRTRFLDRFRRAKAAGEGRPGGGKRSAAWP
ncbi:DUF6397 family protein [Streptomyces venezuelae]|uniref:DUF6397 family protein n=1 Tax=Streptomyces venezuelae TaxID=54571 RepID=UPI00278C00D4|nr:DUF6397 family protein [Streptomyces venezuelae]